MDYSQFLVMKQELALLVVFLLVFLYDTFMPQRAGKALPVVSTVLLLLATAAVALFHFLRWRGYILLPQEADPRQWQVFGVDVSTYQGDVDWPALRAQGVDFAFIKAT